MAEQAAVLGRMAGREGNSLFLVTRFAKYFSTLFVRLEKGTLKD